MKFGFGNTVALKLLDDYSFFDSFQNFLRAKAKILSAAVATGRMPVDFLLEQVGLGQRSWGYFKKKPSMRGGTSLILTPLGLKKKA